MATTQIYRWDVSGVGIVPLSEDLEAKGTSTRILQRYEFVQRLPPSTRHINDRSCNRVTIK